MADRRSSTQLQAKQELASSCVRVRVGGREREEPVFFHWAVPLAPTGSPSKQITVAFLPTMNSNVASRAASIRGGLSCGIGSVSGVSVYGAKWMEKKQQRYFKK